MEKEKATKPRRKGANISRLIIGLLLLGGFSFLLYPLFCNAWNQYQNDKGIKRYEDIMGDISEEEGRRMIEEARVYNRTNPVSVIVDSFSDSLVHSAENSYENILNPVGDGAMGYIEIPKIQIRLVIWHGTEENILAHGCGHVKGTSLPVGGRGTHSVLAAHRGLPTAKLFTDLDRLEEGDYFLISVVKEILAYEVDSIKTVKPEDLDAVRSDSDDDRVTLLTCTPYGVNSHRLLVSGHRIPYEPEEKESSQSMKYFVMAFVATFIMLVCVLCLIHKSRA